MVTVIFSAPVLAQKGKKSNQAPNVSISSPSDGTIYTAPAVITITANANDPDGSIQQVDFYADQTWIGNDNRKPYTVTWSTATADTYVLTAVARDNNGATQTSSPKTIIVNAPPSVTPPVAPLPPPPVAPLPPPPSDTTAPTASITAPAAGAQLSGNVTITASASDNVGVASITLLVDGNAVGTGTTSPLSVTWNANSVATGSHSITARATDAAGNTGTSAPVTVSVVSPPDTTAPTASITSPASGASVTGTVAITASASDNVGVTSVSILVDGASIGSDATSPYTVSWNTAGVAPGSHTIRAQARDAAGNIGTSSSITVTVTAPAPSPATAHFSPSSNDAAVQTYRLDIFTSTANVTTATPSSSKDLGKPPVVSGEYVADISSTLSSLPTGSYVATVSAISNSGSARSAPSPVFAVTATVTTTSLWSPSVVDAGTADAAQSNASEAPSASAGRVWASNSATGIVAAFDATTGDVVGTVAVGLAPSGVAAPRGARAVYVANEGSDTISVIDKTTMSVAATIGLPAPAGRKPRFVSSNGDGSAVYVGEAGSNVVDVIDTATSRIGLRFAAGQPGSTIRGVVTDSTGSILYAVSAGDQPSLNTLAAIEAASGRWLWVASLDDQPGSLTIASDDRTAFVALPATHGILAIDLSQHAVTANVDLGSGNVPDALQWSDDGQVVVTLRSEHHGVAIVDARGVRMVSAQSTAARAVAHDAQHFRYVGVSGLGEEPAVVAVDPVSAAIVQRFRFPGGGVPQTAVLDPR